MFNGVTFGPFELDLQQRELRKHGIRLRLPDQSFEILTILAGRPGQVITREEIRERLWPNGTIVEFEHSINAALKRLRDALGDSAARPRFIETVSRKGYVFVAPVQRSGPDVAGARFRLLEEAGRGAMGVVYRAEDLRLGRPVALKFLPRELAGHPSSLEQLRSEACTAAALNHPNICTLHGIEEYEGRTCLVMEYLEGSPLSRLVEGASLPPLQAIDFAIQACSALEAAHARGIIHRDLKPANLFVTGSGQVKLTDFGIAVWAGESGVAQAGTPSYASPEQVRGDPLDGRSDIFSLGMVLCEMMTGRRAAGRCDAEQSSADLPGDLHQVIVRCVQEDPADRFQSATELKAALLTLKRRTQPGKWRVPLPWRRPVAVIAVALVIAALCITWKLGIFARESRPSVRSIAVLPLVNLSGDAAQEYFADGMTEQLITELAQVSAWEVISRTSVMRYKGSRQPLREIARALGVDGVIEGTVLRAGGRVRITAQLIDAARDKHLWAGSFERDISDVLSLQAGVASNIAGQLNLTLGPRQKARAALARKMVPEAYDAYLLGWYFFDRSQYQKAASHFERATLADPGFALAHALFAEADGTAAFVQDLPFSDRALKAIAQARQLDPNLAEVHALSGDTLFFGNWDWEPGLAEYRRASELDPGSVEAAIHYVIGLHALTRWQAAEQELRRALRMDPVSPSVHLHMLRLLVDTHRYGLALEQFRRLTELDPNSAGAYLQVATVYAALGREDDAVAAFLRGQTLSGVSAERVKALAVSAGRDGFRGCVKERIAQLQEQSRVSPVSPITFATLYARTGDKEKALAFLEAACRQRLPRMAWIKAQAAWDPLRSDPRFQALLRRMRFPD